MESIFFESKTSPSEVLHCGLIGGDIINRVGVKYSDVK